MSRVGALLLILALAASCTTTPSTAPASPPSPTPPITTATATPPTVETAATPPQVSTPPLQALGAAEPRLLPDPTRWVVVDDWGRRHTDGEANELASIDGLQLDFAPVGGDGVPDLGRLVMVNYRSGERHEFENRWGGSSSLGDPIDFALGENGIGRSVHNPEMGFSSALIWQDDLMVSLQTQVADVDLHEFALSITEVDGSEWIAAREGASDQRLLAVEKAMQTIEVAVTDDEPLPHWILPPPWQVEWVTDMTIWTAEQRAQRDALAQASQRPDWADRQPVDTGSWHFGFADTAELAAQQFTPQISVYVSVFEDPPEAVFATNSEPVTVLGLEGVLSPGSGRSVELGRDEVRVFINTTNLPEAALREFLAAIDFASDNPLDGVLVSDQRFQPIEVDLLDRRPPSWHALWKHPEVSDAAISVWRMSVPELRSWMQVRGDGLDIPVDIWERVARGGVVDFTPDVVQNASTTYDVSTNLLIILRNIDRDDLIPIDLDAWIEFADPVNTKPLSPR